VAPAVAVLWIIAGPSISTAADEGSGAGARLAQISEPAVAPPQGAPSKWSKLAPFPEPSEEVLGASANGKLYVFAGLAPGFKPRGLVYEYDPAGDMWLAKKPMPLPSHHVAIAEFNDKIYVFGGFRYPDAGPPAWQPIDNAWEYDPATDHWKALAPMPSRRGAGSAAVVNGKIYVIGGATLNPGSSLTVLSPGSPHRSVGTAEEYDPATNVWVERSPMPTARNHLAAAAVDDKIYTIGGRLGAVFIGTASNTDVVEQYDPASDTWSGVRARMPTARSAVASGVYGRRIYVAGGEFQDSRMMAAFRAVEAYEPATNQWSTMPSMPVARHGLAGAVVGDQLHLVSGDVQSAGTGVAVESAEHDALRLDKAPSR
jgi:N-acetylneuraminic acid mutarotase